MKFLILCTFVTLSVAQIPTFPIFPPNLSTTTTARSNLPPMEPMVPNFPIFPPAQTTLRPVPPTIRPLPPNNNNNNRPPLNSGPWRPGVIDSRCIGSNSGFPTYLPDTTNCRGFFICNAGYAWPMNCPPSITGNVVWSQQDNACREVENPGC